MARVKTTDGNSGMRLKIVERPKVDNAPPSKEKSKTIEGDDDEDDGAANKDGEMETRVRMKKKIYDVLLKHVERTAMALEKMKVVGQD